MKMHHKMSVVIKNWKLNLLAFAFILLFVKLGYWQLARAHEKEIILKSFTERTLHSPLHAQSLSQNKDLRFYPIQLSGQFDNAHTVLLDNKIQEGKIGYEVYTPFKAEGLTSPILIDRGFISIGQSRQILPLIKSIIGKATISGILNLPPAYAAFGEMTDSPSHTWPLRVEYVNLNQLAAYFNYSVTPYILSINPHHPAAYAIKWEIVVMRPEKHRAYAFQWFAFALTLLILSTALNIRSRKRIIVKP
jgi:surfeit locus 1 family protein